MSTKVFRVEYNSIEKANGKGNEPFKESKTVVAKNLQDAITKVEAANKKPFSFIDDETKKKINITRHDFEALSVTLVVESDL